MHMVVCVQELSERGSMHVNVCACALVLFGGYIEIRGVVEGVWGYTSM